LGGLVGKKLDLMIYLPRNEKVGVDGSNICQFGNSYYHRYNSPGFAADLRAKEKIRKHEASTCRFLNCTFAPLVLECTGGVAPQTVNLFKSIKKAARVKRPLSILRRDMQVTHVNDMYRLYHEMFDKAVKYPYRPRRRVVPFHVVVSPVPVPDSPDIKDPPAIEIKAVPVNQHPVQIDQHAMLAIDELISTVESKIRNAPPADLRPPPLQLPPPLASTSSSPSSRPPPLPLPLLLCVLLLLLLPVLTMC
jgi:hypothetical protein